MNTLTLYLHTVFAKGRCFICVGDTPSIHARRLTHAHTHDQFWNAIFRVYLGRMQYAKKLIRSTQRSCYLLRIYCICHKTFLTGKKSQVS